MKKAVLLIGFGGPADAQEVRPFLESVLQGVRIPKERFEEVLHHYDAVGGKSPYNEITFRQRAALEKWFEKKGQPHLVAVGLRHARPSFKDAFKVFKRYDVEKIYGFVLSNFRSYSSFEKYTEKVEEAQKLTGAQSAAVVYTPNFHQQPLFIKAQSEEVKKTIKNFSPKELAATYFLFSSHSIPVEMAQKSDYHKQFEATASLIATELKMGHWSVGYQSRSGSPRDPWLEPGVREVIPGLDKNKFKNLVLIPVGFLCDNVEIIYDLDIELKEAALKAGLNYFRASTVMDHPDFIEMMGQMVLSMDGVR